MKNRSTARAGAPARRPRPTRHRVGRSLALTMMVAGLVVGAFAAPSVAVEGDAGSTVVEVAQAAADGTVGEIPQAVAGAPSRETPAGAVAVLRACEEDETPGLDDCENLPPVCDDLTDIPPCDDNPPPVEECDGVDFNGDEPGCGVDPGPGTDPGPGPDPGPDPNPDPGPGPGPDPGPGPGPGPGTGPVGGSTGTANGSLGTALGQAEGSVPGAEAPAAVTACSDTVICQSAPAATTTSADGLPETGAAENSRELLGAGLGLLVAGGGLVLAQRRGGRRHVGVPA